MRSLSIDHHLIAGNSYEKEVENKDENIDPNPQHSNWINNDGLLVSWLLGIISEEVLVMIEGTETAQQDSLADQLLTMTKENEIHLNESLLSLKKGSLSIDEYLKKFKSLCDQLAAMKKPIDDLTKVFHVARGLWKQISRLQDCYAIKSTIPHL